MCIYIYIHTYTHIYTYIYIDTCTLLTTHIWKVALLSVSTGIAIEMRRYPASSIYRGQNGDEKDRAEREAKEAIGLSGKR